MKPLNLSPQIVVHNLLDIRLNFKIFVKNSDIFIRHIENYFQWFDI